MTTTKVLPHSISIMVKVLSGPHQGEQFILPKDSFSLGRGPDNDVVLINDPKLSRQHIKAKLDNSKLKIENLSSRNLILYNNNFEKNLTLTSEEKIRIGDTELQFTWVAEKTEIHTEVATTSYLTKLEEKTQMAPLPTFSNSIFPEIKVTAATSLKPSVAQPQVHYPQVKSDERPVGDRNNRNNPYSSPFKKNQTKLPTKNEKPMVLIIGGIAVVLLIIIFSFSGEKKIKKSTRLKDTTQLSSELLQNTEYAQQYAKEKHLQEDGRIDRLYESAQSYYIKGFRDYRNGQFTRAITAFQAALSFDPNHVLARKYLHQSIKKQDELMQFNLDQAKRYRDKNNFRLCRASAQNVMVMSPQKGSTEPRYLDAKKLFDECDTLSKGRF